MDLTRTYEWEFDLEEYTMTKDVVEDYLAKVKTGKTCTEEEIIKDIIAERTDIRPETLRMGNQLMGDKIIEKLCEGHIVVTATAIFVPSIPGVFMGTSGRVDSEKNVCVVNVTPTDAIRKALLHVKPKYSGRVRSLGGARVGLIRDVATGKTDGTDHVRRHARRDRQQDSLPQCRRLRDRCRPFPQSRHARRGGNRPADRYQRPKPLGVQCPDIGRRKLFVPGRDLFQ